MQTLVALIFAIVIYQAIKLIELNILSGEQMPFLAKIALVVVMIWLAVKLKKLVMRFVPEQE